MITIAVCLIYYGIAVWLYQMFLWVSDGQWVSIPVLAAWKAVFGVPETDRSVLGMLGRWFLDWPLSLALLVLGVAIISVALSVRQGGHTRRLRLRRKWVAEQCEQAGYTPWEVPKVLADLEAPPATGHEDRKQRVG